MSGIRRCSEVLNNTPPSDDVVPPCAQVTAQTHNGGWLYSCGVSLVNKVLIHMNIVSHCYVAHKENWKTLAQDGFMEQVPEVERLQTW